MSNQNGGNSAISGLCTTASCMKWNKTVFLEKYVKCCRHWKEKKKKKKKIDTDQMYRRTDIHYQETMLRFLGLLTSPSKVVPTLSELNLVFFFFLIDCLFVSLPPSLLMESKNDVGGALRWHMNCVCGRFLPAGGSFL